MPIHTHTIRLVAASAVLLLGTVAGAEQTNYKIGEIGAAELKIGLGSRPVAMGEAFTAVADDLNATAWNPAGLAQMTGLQAGFMHNLYLQETSLEYLAYAQKLFDGAGLGANVVMLNYGAMTAYDDTGNVTGEFTPMVIAATAGYGQWLMPGLAVGGAVKIFSQTIDDQAYTAVAVDVGGLFRPGVEGLQLGLTVQNLGTSVGDASLPMLAKAGAVYALPALITNQDVWRVVADVDLPLGDTNYTSVNLGTEYWIQQAVAMRLGYKIKDTGELGGATGLTAGLGGKLAVSTGLNLGLDYALVSFGDLGMTHQVMITAGF